MYIKSIRTLHEKRFCTNKLVVYINSEIDVLSSDTKLAQFLPRVDSLRENCDEMDRRL